VAWFGNDAEGKIESFEESYEQTISKEDSLILKELFNDDFEGIEFAETAEIKTNQIDLKQEMRDLFADDFLESAENKDVSVVQELGAPDLTKSYEPNSKFEINSQTYDTDDNGHIYKEDGYVLLPNSKYILGGVTYKTDELGRIVFCDGNAVSTPDGERDGIAQNIAGGNDRRPGDQGGHILARIFGGAKGIENMLAMRGPAINQSVYKRMENEVGKALEAGKEVHMHVDVGYARDSQRPSQIKVKYTIDGKETFVVFDNDEGSTKQLETLVDKINESDYKDLKDEIRDANDEGATMSVVAVKTQYDEAGNIEKVTVTIRDENGEPRPVNEDRVYEPKEAA
jgi:hypothetical protein